jgi:hypothetical protein
MLLNKSNSNQVSIKIEKVTRSDAGEYVCYGFPDKILKYSVKKSIEVKVEENVSFNHKIVKKSVYEEEYDENSGEIFVDFNENKQFGGCKFALIQKTKHIFDFNIILIKMTVI